MWSAELIAEITGGRVYQADAARKISGFCIDSRVIQNADCFVAIRGSKTDGHLFLAEAFRRGASGAIIENGPAAGEAGYHNLVAVNDSQTALQRLAAHHRSQFTIPIVAVTGSAGKTTTKEAIKSILGGALKPYGSPGNLNTEIGLPLALLAMPHGTEAAVFELGLQRPGDIKTLCRLLRPTLGVITSIGAAHLEYFQSQSELADEKWELANYLVRQKGHLFINADSPDLISRAKRDVASRPARLTTFGIETSTAQIRAERIDDASLTGTRFEISLSGKRLRADSPLLGRGGVYSVLAASGVADLLHIPSHLIEEQIRQLKPAPHRMELKESTRFGGVIDDSYNANPNSAREAIRTLSNIKTDLKKVLVLGDMLELGPSAPQLHAELADEIAGTEIELIITVGSLAVEIGRALTAGGSGGPQRAVHCQCQSKVLELLEKRLPDNKNIILVKGSRGMALDRLVDQLIG